MPLFRTLACVSLIAAVAGARPVFAGAGEPAVAVELFTSQGCFSCPAAEAYLRRLADRRDIVALEFHVHYWDALVYGAAGKWKDPYSSPAHSDRQRAYNQRIRGRAGVYTPQMVVGGRFERVGSDEGRIEDAIRRARGGAPRLDVAVRRAGGNALEVAIDGKAGPASVWLVTFLRAATTEVRSGENKGKTLVSRHIVTAVREVGRWDGTPARLALGAAPPKRGEGCAVLVQHGSDGPVLGAAYCPAERG